MRLIPLGTGSGLCCVFAGRVTTASSLIVLWGASGLFSSWAYPVSIALLNPLLPAGRRSMMMGLWGTTCALGNLAASAASYYTLRHLGWRWCGFSFPSREVLDRQPECTP